MLTMICLTTSVGALRLENVIVSKGIPPNNSRFFSHNLRANILNQTLVDTHLVAIPGLGTLTARSLTGGDLEGLGGETDRSLDTEVLVLGTLEDLGADLLEDLDLARGEGDADLVALLYKGSYVSNFFSPLRSFSSRFIENVREPRQDPCRSSGKTF